MKIMEVLMRKYVFFIFIYLIMVVNDDVKDLFFIF